MAFYDSIAEQWHTQMGPAGDAFKDLVLNARLLEKIGGIDQQAILELGAGNGYFMPLVLKHFAGQALASLTITDQSERQLDIAKANFEIPGAQYVQLDVEYPFQFADNSFDLILASMIFNEVSTKGFKQALQESARVLKPGGRLLITVTHPAFIDRLRQSGVLKADAEGALTMPAAGSLRLPVVERSVSHYRKAIQAAGFTYDEEECYATLEVLQVRAGLKNTWKIPIALIYNCTRKI